MSTPNIKAGRVILGLTLAATQNARYRLLMRSGG